MQMFTKLSPPATNSLKLSLMTRHDRQPNPTYQISFSFTIVFKDILRLVDAYTTHILQSFYTIPKRSWFHHKARRDKGTSLQSIRCPTITNNK